MKRIAAIAVFAVLAMGAAFPARAELSVTSGTVSMSVENSPAVGGLSCVTLSWTSNAGGHVLATLTEIQGTIAEVDFNPDDTAAPTNLYDVTLSTIDGIDVLRTLGGNLSSSASYGCIPLCGSASTKTVPVSTTGRLTLLVSSAGDTKKGTIRVLFRR